MKFALSPLVFALIFCCGASAAATLPETVEQAILHNPEVLARYHALRAAEDAKDVARGGWMPQVNIQGYAGQENHDYPGTKTGWYNHPGAALQLRQVLFDGLATYHDVKRAGFTKLTRYYELLDTSDSTALGAVQAYLDVLRYRRLVELARDNWATHREVFSQIEDRVKAGVGRRVDLELAAGRLALAQSNWLTETSNLHDVVQRYYRIVGRLPADSLAEAPAVSADLPRDTNPLPSAVAASPAFRAAVANMRAARAEKSQNRAANLPTLELQLARNYERNLDGATGTYNSSEAKVVLNYNLFRGGADQARVRQSSELFYAAQDQRDKVCRDLAQTTAIALNDARALREQSTLLDQHSLSTQKARDAYRQQFDIGQRTLLDLLDTENELFEARRAQTRGDYDRQLADFRVLASAHQILSALKLAPIAKQAPEEDSSEVPAEDAAVNCASEHYLAPTLDTAAAMAGRAPITDRLAEASKKPALSAKLSSDALFDFASGKLRDDNVSALNKFVTRMVSYTLEEVIVTGYTDRLGSESFNQQLSEHRAAAVRDYLQLHGVPADKIRIVGKGSSEPVAKCDEIAPQSRDNPKLRECLAPNRRVVIDLIGTPKR